MTSRRRRRNPDRHLVVARAEDLADLGLTLALLPSDAYGAVIVEASDDDAEPVPAPSRMSVTRVRRGGLDAAVAAWLSEWMPDEAPCDGVNRVWIGAHAGACLDRDRCGRLLWSFERLDVL